MFPCLVSLDLADESNGDSETDLLIGAETLVITKETVR